MKHLQGDTLSWAEEQLTHCDLGDARRTKRLIKMASQLASRIGDSLSSSCRGVSSALEGSYRFIRNKAIKSPAIAEGGFKATAEQAKDSSTLLALEDTSIIRKLTQLPSRKIENTSTSKVNPTLK